MKTKKFDRDFWGEKYRLQNAKWDIGAVSTPLKAYFDQLEDKNLKILIPGTGNSYEAEYLYHKGFKNVFVLDLVQQPLNNLKNRVPGFPKDHLICGDFFKHSAANYDLIIEQTFFCALAPSLRKNYAKKMHELLSPKGKLVGLLFNFPLTEDGPPFGGSEKEYRNTFSPLFTIKALKNCYNSIKPRDGRELFFIFDKN